MFDRETRRVKLLEARIREIKLKMAEDLAKMEVEEEEVLEEVIEEEKEDNLFKDEKDLSAVIEVEEEGEEEEEDLELLEIRHKFFEIIYAEEERRRQKKLTLLASTAFDPDYNPEVVGKLISKMISSPFIQEDETARIEHMKKVIAERKALQKSEEKIEEVEKHTPSDLSIEEDLETMLPPREDAEGRGDEEEENKDAEEGQGGENKGAEHVEHKAEQEGGNEDEQETEQ